MEREEIGGMTGLCGSDLAGGGFDLAGGAESEGWTAGVSTVACEGVTGMTQPVDSVVALQMLTKDNSSRGSGASREASVRGGWVTLGYIDEDNVRKTNYWKGPSGEPI